MASVEGKKELHFADVQDRARGAAERCRNAQSRLNLIAAALLGEVENDKPAVDTQALVEGSGIYAHVMGDLTEMEHILDDMQETMARF